MLQNLLSCLDLLYYCVRFVPCYAFCSCYASLAVTAPLATLTFPATLIESMKVFRIQEKGDFVVVGRFYTT